MHVRRQSDEEPSVIRREVTSKMVAARNKSTRQSGSADQRRESQAAKVDALLQCLVVVRSLMLVESQFLTVERSAGPCSNPNRLVKHRVDGPDGGFWADAVSGL